MAATALTPGGADERLLPAVARAHEALVGPMGCTIVHVPEGCTAARLCEMLDAVAPRYLAFVNDLDGPARSVSVHVAQPTRQQRSILARSEHDGARTRLAKLLADAPHRVLRGGEAR